MARNGDANLTEARTVEKLLRCMSKKYTQTVLAIETLNFLVLSIKEVTKRLKAVQDREEAPHTEPVAVGGKLLYKVEQWRALEKEDEGSSTSKEHRRRPRGSKKKEGKGPWG